MRPSKSWLLVVLFLLLVSSVLVELQLIKHNSDPFNEFVQKKCTPTVTCDPSYKYRLLNGSCNNLENPLWGTSKTPYDRLGQALYADSDHEIRKGSDGKELPGPRELQLGIFLPRSADLIDVRNFHVMQMNQWIAHDITLMATDSTGPKDCCAVQTLNNIPSMCQAVIEIDAKDPFYSAIEKTCLPFRRAMTSTSNFNCSISPQIPVNQATVFIDSSQLYGHTNDKADSLRSKSGGRLKTENIDGQEFFVEEQRDASALNTKLCDGRENVLRCIDGGDPRHNQHFGIIVYQALFMRLHNYLADALQKINPSSSDETLYQEARGMVIAIMQIVVYRDLIPIMFGKDFARTAGLTLDKNKKTVYDPTLMPQLAVELPAAAFRAPHNQVVSKFYFLDKNDKVVNEMNLNEHMSDPDPVTQGSNFVDILRGMSKMPGRYPTASYNSLISNFIFQNMLPNIKNQDLLSIDIQRGRDVGVLTYVQVRELCGFKKISSFNDLNGVLCDKDVKLLSKFYADVADVDLLVGCLLEPMVDDSMVGETTRCVLADGFYRLRYGDRFFCDVEGQPGSFTPEQFDVLWNMNLTTIFCAMSGIDRLPHDIFMAGFDNMYDCSAPFNVDLENWRKT